MCLFLFVLQYFWIELLLKHRALQLYELFYSLANDITSYTLGKIYIQFLLLQELLNTNFISRTLAHPPPPPQNGILSNEVNSKWRMNWNMANVRI